MLSDLVGAVLILQFVHVCSFVQCGWTWYFHSCFLEVIDVFAYHRCCFPDRMVSKREPPCLMGAGEVPVEPRMVFATEGNLAYFRSGRFEPLSMHHGHFAAEPAAWPGIWL